MFHLTFAENREHHAPATSPRAHVHCEEDQLRGLLALWKGEVTRCDATEVLCC